LLQLAISDVELFGSMAEGVELVTNLITRYAIFESVYLSGLGATLACDIVTPPLVKLYAAILLYLTKAKQYYGRSTGGMNLPPACRRDRIAKARASQNGSKHPFDGNVKLPECHQECGRVSSADGNTLGRRRYLLHFALESFKGLRISKPRKD
jgi:hypothetical protein